MATFGLDLSNFQLTFINHSTVEINYDLRSISGDPSNYGTIPPEARAQSNNWNGTGAALEYGNIAVVGIGKFGQRQLAPAPGVRFWSGYNPAVGYDSQYINLLAGNGWEVTRNTSLLSEVTGNGFRVTVDGGGAEPSTVDCYFQVYNA
ncbi:MAG: hypothetical protein JO061_20570 [Acidobacteriaceae bacterium]|nr:hypothetical protein [Acidobacteriaceae bacterium]